MWPASSTIIEPEQQLVQFYAFKTFINVNKVQIVIKTLLKYIIYICSANMEDIFHWCREGNSIQVRLWLDETEHDMNLG